MQHFSTDQFSFINSQNKLLIVDGINRSGKTKAAVERMIRLSNNGEWTLYLVSSQNIERHVYNFLYTRQFEKGHKKNYIVVNIDTFLLNYICRNTNYKKENIIMYDYSILINLAKKFDKNINYTNTIERFKEILNNNILTVDDYINYETNNITIDEKKHIFKLLEKSRNELKTQNKKLLDEIYIEFLNSNKKFNIDYLKNGILFKNFKHIIVDRADNINNIKYKLLRRVFLSLKEKEKNYSISLICNTFENNSKNIFLESSKIKKLLNNSKIKYLRIRRLIENNDFIALSYLHEIFCKDVPKKELFNYNNAICDYYIMEPYIILYNNLIEEMDGTLKIIKKLLNMGYTLNDMRIISFTRNKLNDIENILENKYQIKTRCRKGIIDYSGKKIELVTPFEVEYLKQKDVIFILGINSILELKTDINDNKKQEYKKKIKLLYDSLDSGKDLIFISKYTEENKYINSIYKKYKIKTNNIKDIENELNKYTYENIHLHHSNYEHINYDELAKCSSYSDNYDELYEYNSYDDNYNDSDSHEYDNYDDYNDYFDTSLENYVSDAFDGDMDACEDYYAYLIEKYG